MADPFVAGVRESESLFSRNEDDQLIVREKATRERFNEQVTLSIDGYEIEIQRALPWTDFLGNKEMDLDGLPKPRSTTIYDAAKKLAEELVKKGVWDHEELGRRIPILCHRDHLDPVAVCRMCSVHVSKKRRRDGRIMPSPKLVPACQHEVQAGMVVTTRAAWDGFCPEEKIRLANEKVALQELQASGCEGAEPEAHHEWLRRARILLRISPNSDRDDLLRKISTRLQWIEVRRSEDERLLHELAILKDLRASAPDDNTEDAFEPWLDRARTMLHIEPKDIRADLLRRASARLQNIDEQQKAVADYGAQTHESIRILSELLLADHCPRETESDPRRFENELEAVGQRLGVQKPRPAFQRNRDDPSRNQAVHPRSRPIRLPLVGTESAEPATEFPYSSRSIQVDHDRCILCERCVRSCSEVKPFQVIGHTGKGYQTRISFDLDKVMSESSCVQCGECMTACPTGALTLNRRVIPKPVWQAFGITSSKDHRLVELADPIKPLPAEFLTADQLPRVQLTYLDEGDRKRAFRPFEGIPYAFLRWNEGAVRRRTYAHGDVLCRQGEFGSTAFLLEDGEIEVRVDRESSGEPRRFWASLFGGRAKARDASIVVDRLRADHDLIAGEMACLTNSARTATLVAAGNLTVLEVTRNLLHMLQRAPGARDVLNRVYRRRAIDSCLRRGKLFSTMTAEDRASINSSLLNVAQLRRAEPGEVVVAEGAREGDFYIVRQGFVKVARSGDGRETVLAHLGPSDYFGEIALLGYHPDVERAALSVGINPRIRTATCSALGTLEVVHIPGDAFRAIMRQYPAIEKRLVQRCVELLGKGLSVPRPHLAEYLNQGLFQSQKMLVLDLESCTRCDECTRACADAHGDGHSRLLREGLRFGKFLVAASCRSCHQPYCMDGCPVDAIHRDSRSLEVLIDNHCIGCSLCERNCPYGSIQMVPRQAGFRWSDLLDDVDGEPQLIASVERQAINCDLCHGLVKPGQEPFCVSACPHEAAFRWSGETLLDSVLGR